MDSRFLKSIDLFSDLPDKWLRLADVLFEERTCDADEIVFRAGDPAEALYIVESGQVTVFSDTVGEPVTLMARIGVSELFGEIGVLEDSPRSASARASETTRLLCLARADLISLARVDSGLRRKLAQLAVARSLSDQAKLEVGQRREMRIKVGCDVLVRIDNRPAMIAFLENLSAGGAFLRGIPEALRMGPSVGLSISVPGGEQLLTVGGKVAWRRDANLGVTFVETARDHRRRVARTLEILLTLVMNQDEAFDRPTLGGGGAWFRERCN